MKTAFHRADILLPKEADMTKWSTVACDQYTSEPHYWEEVEALVGDAPSTLHMVFPEIYLEEGDADARIAAINTAMHNYCDNGLFNEYSSSIIYMERIQRDGRLRRGLVAMIDLTEYDYNRGASSLIRATEGTVLERIPPRVKVRRDACLETPHVMLLIDDPERSVIEPLTAVKSSLSKVYDFDLMADSGHLDAYLLDEKSMKAVEIALEGLLEDGSYKARYGDIGSGKLLFAVGDGNHSLATAKECYTQLKDQLTEEEWLNHPARFALVEVVNVHEAALEFEPIHRVLFDVDVKNLLSELAKYYDVTHGSVAGGQSFSYVSGEGDGVITVKNPSSNLAVGTLQNFLDNYLSSFDGKIDYIHGDEVVGELGRKPGNIGFLLPGMDKADLFKTVLLDGALPRKTFSMGHAWDKRFYTECRKIK